MKTLNLSFVKLVAVSLLIIFTASCSGDDDLYATVSINEGQTNDIGGDFIGNGGSASRTFSWTNNLTTADYNADITGSIGGSFFIIVKDADGTVVLQKSLVGGAEPDSFSGVTSAGNPGTWNITISLEDFDGDGSFTLSEGN